RNCRRRSARKSARSGRSTSSHKRPRRRPLRRRSRPRRQPPNRRRDRTSVVTQAAAPLARRLFSLFYEVLLLAAVLWLAALAYALVESALSVPHVRPLYHAYLVLVAGIYFAAQWSRGGQTLAMKTWRLKLERRDGG